jgi:hypothetical protein
MGDESPISSKHRPSYFTPKIKFTPEEDDTLRALVEHFGASNWRAISARHGTRNARQCRERWQNYLDPRVSERAEWSPADDALLEDAYREIGSRWGTLASYFPTRSINSVKNRFAVLQRQKQRARGADEPPQEPARLAWPPSLEHGLEPFSSPADGEGSAEPSIATFSDDQDGSRWLFETM